VKPPLARAIRGAGLDVVDVAARLDVDPKTVQRWLAGRLPYPRHRAALVELTGWTDRDLWPSASPPPRSEPDEVLITYPHRSAVPSDAWRHLFGSATREIGVLAYSGLFLAEDAEIQKLLRDKARTGVRVRIVLGDPAGEQVAQRGADEDIDSAIVAKIRNALVLYRALTEETRAEVRLHDTVLYNSIYRADDDLLVNPHVYGSPAAHAPVIHLRRTEQDGMAATYLDSFERVWASARAAG
jgi:phosphatidylserine/phosphatidylglycerophosphate/cardiolipin synthase-like enzyme